MSKLVISTALIGAMLCAAPAYASSHQKTKSDAALIRYLEKPLLFLGQFPDPWLWRPHL
jgi:hypothetical protein